MNTIYYTEVDSPIGLFHVGVTERGICMFEFPIAERIERHRRLFESEFQVTNERPSALCDALESQINAYFNNSLTEFSLPLDLIGTPFQIGVWQELQKISFGKTVSYQELSLQMNQPLAIRAIARANGENRTALLVPCHRVISKQGKLTGYSGELWRKEYLLEKETGQSRFIF